MSDFPKIQSLVNRWLTPSLGFALAYALPPKVMDLSYRNSSVISSLPRREAKRIEIFSKDPVLHGALALSRDRRHLLVMTPDGSAYNEWPLLPSMNEKTKSERHLLSRELRESLFESRRVVGPFSLNADRLSFKPERDMPGPLWETPLGFEASGISARSSDAALMGWASHPARLFVFPAVRRFLYRIDWSEGSEPVSFAPCDDQRSLLAENLQDGTSRLVVFEGFNPKEQSIFDFTGDKRLSSLTGLLALSCDEVVAAGSFGLVHLNFRN